MLTRLFSIIAAASLIAAAGALGFMATDRESPIEYVGVKLTSLRVPPGGEMEREIRFVQHKTCNIHVERTLYDSAGTQYPVDALDYPFGIGEIGVLQSFIRKVEIPTNMALGVARLERHTVYRCNPLHWIWPIYIRSDPVFFEIVP